MSSSNKFISFILLSVITPGVLAQPFSWQLALDRHEAYSGDLVNHTAEGKYFFTPVSADTGPLQQAGFISRSSSVSLFYSESDNDAYVTPIGDADSYGVSGQYIARTTGWFVGAGYASLDSSDKSDAGIIRQRYDADGEDYTISVGKYLFQNTTLALSYQKQKIDELNATFQSSLTTCGLGPCAPLLGSVETTTESDNYAINFKHLGVVKGVYYELSASYTDIELSVKSEFIFDAITLGPAIISPIADPGLLSGGALVALAVPLPMLNSERDLSSYTMGVAVYPVRSLSVGVDYSVFDNDTTKPETLALAVEWFVLPSLAVRFSYGKTNFEDQQIGFAGLPSSFMTVSTSDVEDYSLGISARF